MRKHNVLVFFFFFLNKFFLSVVRKSLSYLLSREVIQMDMDVWEKSGQWGFSCYYSFKTLVSGVYEIFHFKCIFLKTETLDLNMFPMF